MKRSKKLVAFLTMVCVVTAMAVPVFAKTTSIAFTNVTYTGSAVYDSSVSSYHKVDCSLSGAVSAESMVCQYVWWSVSQNTYIEGEQISGKNTKSISGTDSIGPKGSYTSCNVFFIVTKGGVTKQGTVKPF